MTDLEKLKRFDEEMRKRFGAQWAVPAPVPPEDRGEALPEIRPERRGQLIRETVQGIRRDPAKDSGTQKAGPVRTKPNRRENEFMMNFMILRNALVAMGPDIRERARRAGKTTWRDIRLMTRLCCKVQGELLETMPAQKDDYYRTYSEHGHYELMLNGPIQNKRMVLISDKYLGALCEAAMENDCCMCMLEGNEIADCQLRQALLEVAPPKEVMDGKWTRCEYREAAGQLIRGQEVTV